MAPRFCSPATKPRQPLDVDGEEQTIAGRSERRPGSGRSRARDVNLGYGNIHSAVDDHLRVAYSEILTHEQGPTANACWQRAQAFFAAHGTTVRHLLSHRVELGCAERDGESFAPDGHAHQPVEVGPVRDVVDLVAVVGLQRP